MMRLFVALPLADPARGEVVALLGRLRGSDWPVRWVGDEGLHLTIKFFGEVAADRLDVIAGAVQVAAAGTAPFPLKLGELGAFPHPRRARVIWVGLEAAPGLELLQDRVEREAEAIGFVPEGTAFRPHVSLGRVRERQRLPRRGLADYAESYQRVSCLGDRLVLYESALTAAGPRYTSRLTLELGA
jgi:2'-5' RNA ligase